MPERFFYHSFPRRGANRDEEIEKGCLILQSLIDIGLALIPEYIEWRQPLADGNARITPKLQKRACFTELSPSELAQHSDRFGHFAIEFDQMTMRALGGIPVFYIPQVDSDIGGNQLGVALLNMAADAHVIVNRLNSIQNIVDHKNTNAYIRLTTRFSMNPESEKTHLFNKKQAAKVIDAVTNATTPLPMLNLGLDYLLNMFYPADDLPRDRPLDYYRQREWRIACPFAVMGVDVMRGVEENEKDRFIQIDEQFFTRNINTGNGEARIVDLLLIIPGINERSFVQLARRIVVPNVALDRVTAMMAAAAPQVPVIGAETLADAD